MSAQGCETALGIFEDRMSLKALLLCIFALSVCVASAAERTIDLEAGKQFWAFQPLHRPPLPSISASNWPRTPIDAFILSALQKKGLAPAPIATRRKLIRRAYFDLVGLAPSPAEVDAFIHDPSPDAYDKLIDRLLQSPRYGERWARHWLDVARFAESDGFEHDSFRPAAFQYRDFVIRALNADMPFDRFVQYQIAGDEIAPDDWQAMAATGFLSAGVFPTQITEREFEVTRYNQLDDMVSTVGSAMLGLTIGCARCHDHKYDPIPTLDYYRFVAAFGSAIRSDIGIDLSTPEQNRQLQEKWESELAGLRARQQQLELTEVDPRFDAFLETLADHPMAPAPGAAKKKGAGDQSQRGEPAPPAVDAPTAKALNRLAAGQAVTPAQRQSAYQWFAATLPDYRAVHESIERLEKAGYKQLTMVQVTSEGLPPVQNLADGRGYPHFYKTVYHLRRGDPANKVEPVTASFLRVLMRDGKDESAWLSPPPAGARTSHRRLGAARWITDAGHGAGNLLARVIVNRVWQHHFGRGIVSTPNDFGAQGDRPSHPELLDYLANDLIDHGWQLKRLHKLIMTSSVYCESSEASPPQMGADPQNVYLWHWQPRRLEAEPIRDAMLAVSGTLDETMYGPGTLDQSMRRRSIYFTVKRAQLIPMMMVLDWPEPLSSVGARPTTTVAPQALLFTNSPQARQYAEAFAARVASQSMSSAITAAYQLALARPPEDAELAAAEAFIDRQKQGYAADAPAHAERSALTDFCQALLSANEFVYID